MESHELLRDVFQKISPKQAAAELGLSLSMVYKWAEPPNQRSGAANPLDRVAVLMQCSEDSQIAQWVCQKAGGFFVKNPRRGTEHPLHLVPAMNTVVQEFADLLSIMAAASHDSHITTTEARSIRRALGRTQECHGRICPLLRRREFSRPQETARAKKISGNEIARWLASSLYSDSPAVPILSSLGRSSSRILRSCVFGGTSAGVVAAVQAARAGQKWFSPKTAITWAA